MSSFETKLTERLQNLHQLGGPRFVQKMITLFLAAVEQRMGEMREAEGSGDLGVMERAAHSLKSSAGNVGAALATELCERIETAAGSGQADGLKGLVAELSATLDQVTVWLRAQQEPKS